MEKAYKLEFIIESDNKLYPIDVKKSRGTPEFPSKICGS